MVALTNAWTVDDAHVEQALREAELRELRLIYDSSNHVFLATLVHDDYGQGLGVYKPARGEQPLHDFPYGTLHRRELAAYELSRLLGWDLIPPTVEREGPEGVGSLQLFIEHNPAEHYFEFRTDERHHERLVRFAAFDLLANNADRKGGHLLRDERFAAVGHRQRALLPRAAQATDGDLGLRGDQPGRRMGGRHRARRGLPGRRRAVDGCAAVAAERGRGAGAGAALPGDDGGAGAAGDVPLPLRAVAGHLAGC